MKLFQYAAIYIPDTDNEAEKDEKPAIVIEPTTVLAKDEKTAAMLAAREIPSEYVDKIDRVEVAVRSF